MKKIAIADFVIRVYCSACLRSRTYVGLSAGQNDMDVAGVIDSTAYSVFGGYSFNEYIAGGACLD